MPWRLAAAVPPGLALADTVADFAPVVVGEKAASSVQVSPGARLSPLQSSFDFAN